MVECVEIDRPLTKRHKYTILKASDEPKTKVLISCYTKDGRIGYFVCTAEDKVDMNGKELTRYTKPVAFFQKVDEYDSFARALAYFKEYTNQQVANCAYKTGARMGGRVGQMSGSGWAALAIFLKVPMYRLPELGDVVVIPTSRNTELLVVNVEQNKMTAIGYEYPHKKFSCMISDDEVALRDITLIDHLTPRAANALIKANS